jgi:uncharacterized repeat protein (TIGR03809 family)
MSLRAQARPYDEVARKWRDLAERRREHFVELYESGRWKYYYSEAEFIREMREVVKAAEDWARIAPHGDTPTERLPQASGRNGARFRQTR